jgi:hypothetical protein
VGSDFSGLYALDSRKIVEASVETEDPLDAVNLHHRDMNGIARGETPPGENDGFRSLDGQPIHGGSHRQPEATPQTRFDGVTSVDGDVSVEDFLQHLGIGNEPLTSEDESFERPLGRASVKRPPWVAGAAQSAALHVPNGTLSARAEWVAGLER